MLESCVGRVCWHMYGCVWRDTQSSRLQESAAIVTTSTGLIDLQKEKTSKTTSQLWQILVFRNLLFGVKTKKKHPKTKQHRFIVWKLPALHFVYGLKSCKSSRPRLLCSILWVNQNVWKPFASTMQIWLCSFFDVSCNWLSVVGKNFLEPKGLFSSVNS